MGEHLIWEPLERGSLRDCDFKWECMVSNSTWERITHGTTFNVFAMGAYSTWKCIRPGSIYTLGMYVQQQ